MRWELSRGVRRGLSCRRQARRGLTAGSFVRGLLLTALAGFAASSPGCAEPTAEVWAGRGPAGRPESPWEAGEQEAERDLATGRLVLRADRLRPFRESKFQAEAKRRLGVEFELVAGLDELARSLRCSVPLQLSERTGGYNTRMMRELDRRFGPGALDRIAAEFAEEFNRWGCP